MARSHPRLSSSSRLASSRSPSRSCEPTRCPRNVPGGHSAEDGSLPARARCRPAACPCHSAGDPPTRAGSSPGSGSRRSEDNARLRQGTPARRQRGAARIRTGHTTAHRALLSGAAADSTRRPRKPCRDPYLPTPAPSRPAAAKPTPPRRHRTRSGAVDEATAAFDAAEAALARHDLKAAENHAIRATHLAPKRPEFAALFAWVCAHSGEEDALPEGVRTLTRILEEHPKCEPALYYRGMLLKRAGKDKAALRDFVMILDENPTHAHALGEVRELRKKKK